MSGKIFPHRRLNPLKNLPPAPGCHWEPALTRPLAEERASRQVVRQARRSQHALEREAQQSQHALKRAELEAFRACQPGEKPLTKAIRPGYSRVEDQIDLCRIIAAKAVGGTKVARVFLEALMDGLTPQQCEGLAEALFITIDMGLLRANFTALLQRPPSAGEEVGLAEVRAERIRTIEAAIEQRGSFWSSSEPKPFTSIEQALSTPWFSLTQRLPHRANVMDRALNVCEARP